MGEEVARARVMVVEDDPEVSKAIARKLGGDGHDLEMLSEPKPVLDKLEPSDRRLGCRHPRRRTCQV